MKSIKHLDFFCVTIPLTLNHFDRTETKPAQFFALGLLRRLLHSSKSLKILLKNFTRNQEVAFSVGIIIRSLLLDMLISLNFYKLIKDNLANGFSMEEIEIKLTEFCEKILSDGLKQTVEYIEQSVGLGFNSKEDVAQAFNNFAKNYQYFFTPHIGDGTKPKTKYKEPPKAKQLFKNLAEDKDMRWISGVYDSYLYYSKYDHFGILYYDIIHENLGEKIRMIDRSVGLLTRHCTILYETLDRYSKNDPCIKEEYEKVAAYMYNTINSSE